MTEVLPPQSSPETRPDKAPVSFAALLFGRTPQEDRAGLKPRDLAVLADAAWKHLKERPRDGHALRVFNPDQAGLSDITVIEAVNPDMPFLLDSTVAALAARGIEPRLVAHPILAIERDEAGVLTTFDGEAHGESGPRESLIHLHVDRIDDEDDLLSLQSELAGTYADIRHATRDFQAMRGRVADELAELERHAPPVPEDDAKEALDFLRWVLDGNFIFVGLRDYRDVENALSNTPDTAADTGLGILRDPDVRVLRRGTKLVAMTPEIRQFLKEPVPLIVTKASLRSRIHRRSHLDYIGVKRFAPDGTVTGELRIVGLFAGSAYSRPADTVPLIRRKLSLVSRHAGFDPDSHSARALASILDTYPRDELFQIDVDTLFDFSMQMLSIYERPRVRVLARPDRFDRFVSVLVFVPREKYDSDVRMRIGERLAEAYGGRVAAFNPSFLEGVPLTRVHYIIGRYDGPTPKPDLAALERDVAAEIQTWPDRLKEALRSAEGAEGRRLGALYGPAFSAGYREAFAPKDTVDHIKRIESLSDERPFAIIFDKIPNTADRISLKIFSLNRSLPLTERVPILSHMGFVAVDERTYDLCIRDRNIYLHDMTLARAAGGEIDLDASGDRLTALTAALASGRSESDLYNALILEAGLDWRCAALLRTTSRYLRQANIPFSHEYMATVLVRHAEITKKVVDLFMVRFDPEREDGRADAQAAIRAEIEEALADVESLDEDRIIRRFVNLVESMLRTNFFQRDDSGAAREVISFKLDGRRIEALPAPRPLYEIFLSSPRVEGLHLRFGRVARGGIRWSDRPEDFRTEILGLVKAQQVKNAVIVPVGAKGGFVPKRLPLASDRAAWLAEGTEAYRIFISTLLDLTDTIENGEVVHPPMTIRHDSDDPYMVVAADKGTATFSDVANEIALDRGFWLGDAFASGGSAGYDHKKMGITARGAWEAVKRHFRELDRDIQSEPFTVAGVGDMSGDVFGNGMLLSRQIRLVAAFDHRDIFFDPDPDPAKSWAERKRLFDLPRSSWQDYDKSLISEGGGVFSRAQKSIPLTEQMRALTGLAADAVTPQQLISAILKLNVDLLFFGGIGTYIRSSDETDQQAGDRANDAVRIAGRDVRATVIGEGANLGVTQLGRIEAAQNGVRLNTDAIDNSAGVNTSDYEVNIKIALAPALADGRTPLGARNNLLASMTDDVANLVLANNHRQTLALSLALKRGMEDLGFEQRLMQMLEAEGLLDRAVEFLPDDADLARRLRDGHALARPELAVLLAYAKNALFSALLDTGVPDDPYLGRELARYFPAALREPYRADIDHHRLRREVIATRLVNAMIDLGGPSLLVRLQGARVEDIAAAFAAVRDSYRLNDLLSALDALDAKIPGSLHLDLYACVQNLLLSRMSWFLRYADLGEGLDSVVMRFREGLDEVRDALSTALSPEAEEERRGRAVQLAGTGVPDDLALWLASLPALEGAPDIVLVAEAARISVPDAAETLFAVHDGFGVGVLRDAADKIATTDHFERIAKDRALGALASAARAIAVKVAGHGVGQDAFEAWEQQTPSAAATQKALADIARSGVSLAKLSVAADMLEDLASS